MSTSTPSRTAATQLLRIGLDSRPLQADFKAHSGRGTGRYTDELARALVRLQEEQDLPFAIELLSPPPVTNFDARMQSILPLGKRTFESQFVYPRQVRRTGVDLMHFFSHGDAPSRPILPQVVTVLDLIPLRFPELYRAEKSNLRFRFARHLELQAVRKARGIFAISEATKRDIVSLLQVDPEAVVVTPLAVTKQFSRINSQPLIERVEAASWDYPGSSTLRGRRPIVLYVGGIDPRKNVPFLIDVLVKVSAEREAYGELAPLVVLAGDIANDDQYPGLKQRIRESGIGAQVLELGRVSEVELQGLYQHADLFLFPSLYEGFGLPVLEAMACGCAVVAGNNSSIPEVTGEDAVLLADCDIAAWSQAVNELLAGSSLRSSYAERGALRAEQFSWEHTARLTIEGYCKFLSLPEIGAVGERRNGISSSKGSLASGGSQVSVGNLAKARSTRSS